MTSPADLLDSMGYEVPPVEWRTVSDPPVPPAEFGSDHYSTLLYVEHRAVDHRGYLSHDNMRCDGNLHPILLMAKRRTIAFGTEEANAAGRYPTRLRDGVERTGHDDYSCLDDMLAAGWLTVTMPTVKAGRFVDAYGKTVKAGRRSPASRTPTPSTRGS